MKMFNWAITWVLLLAVSMIFVSAPQSSPIEGPPIDFVNSESPDVLQISIENTGSDFWSEATFDAYVLVICPFEVNKLNLPQINRLSYWLFALNSYTNNCWDRRMNANKNNYIA